MEEPKELKESGEPEEPEEPEEPKEITSFALFKLSDKPIKRFLRGMEVLELLEFLKAYPQYRGKISKYVNPGNFHIAILEGDAHINVGSFGWMFQRRTVWDETDAVIKTLGPLTINVYAKVNMYCTKTPYYATCALKFASWLMNLFPMMKPESLHLYGNPDMNPQVLTMIRKYNVNIFNESRLVFRFQNTSYAHQFFDDAYKGRQLMVLRESGTNFIYKVVDLLTLKDKALPVDPRDWFKNFLCLDRQVQYISIINTRIYEEHLNRLIAKWVNNDFCNLFIIQVRNVSGLKMHRISEGFQTEPWSDSVMRYYGGNPLLTKYYNQKGLIVRNEINEYGSIHLNEREKTFTFVVWRHDRSEKCLNLFSDFLSHQASA